MMIKMGEMMIITLKNNNKLDRNQTVKIEE